MTIRTLTMIAVAALLGACSWGIKLEPAAKDVHVAWNDDVSGCRELGKISVSVLDHVGPLDRNNIKVRDELEVMARNEAVSMHADTIKPTGDPRDGEQNWRGYDCKGVVRGKPAKTTPQPSGDQPPAETKTYPIKHR